LKVGGESIAKLSDADDSSASTTASVHQADHAQAAGLSRSDDGEPACAAAICAA